MCFFFQETGEVVGTVVSVFDSGASDLLQVKLNSIDILDATGKQKSEGARVSDHLVWIPFAEAIVPNVDVSKREMHITPPKGLLELNLRFDDRSKKERRQLVRHTLLLSYTDLLVQCYSMFKRSILGRTFDALLYVVCLLLLCGEV